MPIYDLHGPLINNHTLVETPSVHSMHSTIHHKLEYSIRNSPLDISFYKVSAADMIRYHYHLRDPSPLPSSFTIIAEDQYSSSSASLDSTTSSPVSDVTTNTDTMPTPAKTKKRTHKRLLREIRRLRSENTTLQNSVNILKEDLRHERESRQIAEQCHRKFFDDSMDTHTRLNLEIMDQQDQLLAYQSRLNDAINSTSTTISHNNNNNRFDDDANLFNDDYLLWGCDDMNCSNERQCYSDTTDSDFGMDMEDDDDDDGQHSTFQSSYCDRDDDKDSNNNDHQFEGLAISYLRQALISNLTSARANLEFDDLMLKHDPSPVKVLRTLADAFLGWIREIIHTSTTAESATSCTTITDEQATCVARLMTTQVQDVFLRFWKDILERYVHNDEDQYQFLRQAERTLHHHYNPNHHHHHQQQQQQQNESYYIVQNFHRLLVMLYKYDIVDGDAVVHWWHDHLLESHSLDKDDGDNDYPHDDTVADQLRDVTRKFVEWIDEEEEDDYDDDGNGNEEDLFANDDDGDYQYDSELDYVGVDEDDDDDELMDDDHYSRLLGPTLADDSNVSRTPIQPVERKKKSVTIQV